MILLLLAMVLNLPPEARVVLELDCPGNNWVNTIHENSDGSISLKITRARRDYGGECLMTDIRDFDFLTLSQDGDTLNLTTHRSTDAYMLWDVLEMSDSAGYILYGDYREIPDNIGEPNSDWYFNDTFPFSAFQLTHISIEGDTLWKMQWHEDSLSNGMAMKLLNDNSVLALVGLKGPEGREDALLSHISHSGDLIWEQSIPNWDGIYPFDIACNGYSVIVVHGSDLNRHHLIDLETGVLLRTDTLPPEESVYIYQTHNNGVSDVLVCRSGNYASGPKHIGFLLSDGYGEDAIRLGAPLEENGPVANVFACAQVDGSAWALIGNGGWEDPRIQFVHMHALDTAEQTLTMTGITGIPDSELLRYWDISEFYDSFVEWSYRPVGSLQYLGNGRFIMGITNSVMLEMSEILGFRLCVIELEIPEM